MKKVLFRAPILTNSGYGVHARQICKWLLKKEEAGDCSVSFHVLPWGDTPWFLRDDLCDGLVGKVMSKIAPDEVKPDVLMSLQLPNEWAQASDIPHIGMSAVVETDICNPKWVEAVNKMTAVIVPSNHAKKALENSGMVLAPILVIPESYPENFQNQNSELNTFNFSTKFNFLIVGQITGDNSETDRKNIFLTIKWICEQFENNPDVGIILKTNCGSNTALDRERTQAVCTRLIKECRKSEFPRLHLVHGDLSTEEMKSLYTHETVKAYVSLSRGEGFGLPTLEAATLGVPVIATNWSGHLDYLNLGKFISIN